MSGNRQGLSSNKNSLLNMKKNIAIGILLLLVFGLTEVAGQRVPRFVNKRIKSTEKSTEEKIGKEVDKAIGKLLGIDEGPAKDTAQAVETPSSSSTTRSPGTAIGQRAMLNAMGLSAGTANVKPVYEFDGYVEMLITDYKEGKEEQKVTYTTFIDSKTLDYGLEFSEPGSEGTSTIIFDTENSLMLTLAEDGGEKNGFAVSFTPDQAEAISDDFSEESNNSELVDENVETEVYDPYKSYKTGKTKKILGYNCEEYVIEDDNVVSTMWITDDLNKDMRNSYMQNSTFAGMFIYAYYTSGTVMEYITEYRNSNEKSVMRVTGIDMNKRSSISTQGYNIISMGTNMGEDSGDDTQKNE